MPSSWVIGTIILTSQPPYPSLLPLAVNPLFSPSFAFLQIRPLGALASSAEFEFVCETYPIQIKCNVFFQISLLNSFSSVKISIFRIIERFYLKVSFLANHLFVCLVSISFVNFLFHIRHTLAKDTLHSSATSLAVYNLVFPNS